MNNDALVYVVDDDAAVRHFLSFRLEMEGFAVKTFPDGAAFTRGYDAERPGCVVTDLRMPHMDGLEVQQWMAGRVPAAPVIIMTGHGDLPAAVTAFREGVFDFLEKPFDDDYLVQRIRVALAANAERHRRHQSRREAARKHRHLTRREREVAALLVEGRSNKAIAAALGLGLRTVESHRFRIMKKLGASSICDVTRMMAELEG